MPGLYPMRPSQTPSKAAPLSLPVEGLLGMISMVFFATNTFGSAALSKDIFLVYQFLKDLGKHHYL